MSDSREEKRRRRNPSLFAPIVLIAIGVYFLLQNMGVMSGLNWIAALQLWPLLLIFIGINIIVRQAPRPLGTLLSALVGLTAVAVFGYVLLFGEGHPLLARLGVTGRSDYQTETIEFAAEDIESAVIDIDFDAPGGHLYALEDSANLIEGTVSTIGDLTFDTDVSGGRATVTLNDRNSGFFWFNPGNWGDVTGANRWEIGLNPNVPLDLRLDAGSGAVSFDLSQLTLNDLFLDSGSGSVELLLSAGEYDVVHNAGSGSTRLTLPGEGQVTAEIDGGSGSLVLFLPASMAARVEVDGGSGSFNPDDRFTLVSGERDGDGVWETPNYEDARDQLNLILDIGSGSVRIEQPQGR
ncbi:MAG TPA: DUF5668 domain-containing protein [Anaerolineae bacterium]